MSGTLALPKRAAGSIAKGSTGAVRSTLESANCQASTPDSTSKPQQKPAKKMLLCKCLHPLKSVPINLTGRIQSHFEWSLTAFLGSVRMYTLPVCSADTTDAAERNY